GEFLGALAELCRGRGIDVVYGTVRQIRRDVDTRLAWAREEWACVVLNLHLQQDSAGQLRMSQDLRALYGLALAFGGSFYLTYGLHAQAGQLRQAYPDIDEVLAAKSRIDPHAVLQSNWLNRLRALLGRDAMDG